MSDAETPRAVALVRSDMPPSGVDLESVAERYGYRLVYTVVTEAGAVVTTLAVVQHAREWAAGAVVVPGFAHAYAVRQVITGFAALVTPTQLYPRGHRWPADALRFEKER
ncbi:hypothetical protein NLM24_33930 [Nocardia zapadnayensis]|uniref:hypothetical protein n=1 Tax=Nocardia rhamnosiphila TaxID=426716 RepID=UPI0022481B43|nr:hypothetical protein [Nocardia zapadnayensis]MCX0275589.1 hypothetical protein [Nocardia zapadnayensis]